MGGDDAQNGRALTFTSSTDNTGSNGALHTISATSGNGAIALDTAGTERLRIKSTGQVGIGTDDPQEDLHIGSNSPYILLEDYDNSREWKLKGTAWFAIEDATAGVDRFRILNNGRVGINTTNPNALLDVY